MNPGFAALLISLGLTLIALPWVLGVQALATAESTQALPRRS